MAKEPRCKCRYCGARHRDSFMSHFPDKSVCPDCCYEYRKIFFNFKNRDKRKIEENNPLFEAFKRGWEKEEVSSNLTYIKIPESLKNYYHSLWLLEKRRWDQEE